MASNPAEVSDCSPSLQALSGLGWTSTMRPSAPAATRDTRQGRNQVAMAGGVAGVGDDGQVRDLLEQRNGGYVEGVARGCFKGANAALAENDVGVAVIENNLRRAQQIGHRGHHAALQQDGTARTRRGFKQRVVLHVARADLQDVGILGNQRNVVFGHDFGDDGQAGFCARAGEHLEAFEAMTLKCIRRAAGLEGAAAQDAGAGAAHMMGGGHELELGLNRAGASHGDELVAADFKIEHRHHSLLALRTFENIGCLGKSFLPTFAHSAASIPGKRQTTLRSMAHASTQRWRCMHHV